MIPWNLQDFFVGGFGPVRLGGAEGGVLNVIEEEEIEVVVVVAIHGLAPWLGLALVIL